MIESQSPAMDQTTEQSESGGADRPLATSEEGSRLAGGAVVSVYKLERKV